MISRLFHKKHKKTDRIYPKIKLLQTFQSTRVNQFSQMTADNEWWHKHSYSTNLTH